MKRSPPLSIELDRSRIAGALVLIAYLSTAALVAFLPCATIYRGLAVIAIGAHGLWTLRGFALRTTRDAVVRVEVAADGQVTLSERRGRRCAGHLQPASYVVTWLTTVVVRIEGGRRSRALAVLPDMSSAEALRQLRVLLRVAGTSRL